jgi:hypothetical protein
MGSLNMKVWEAAPAVPQDYPAGLPFVPNLKVGIEEEAEGVVVMKWWGVERPLEVMQQLLGASVQDGWAVHDDLPAATGDAGSIRRISMRRGGNERVVEAIQAAPFSFVTLTERPLE